MYKNVKKESYRSVIIENINSFLVFIYIQIFSKLKKILIRNIRLILYYFKFQFRLVGGWGKKTKCD